jgi:hypothetical protein
VDGASIVELTITHRVVVEWSTAQLIGTHSIAFLRALNAQYAG